MVPLSFLDSKVETAFLLDWFRRMQTEYIIARALANQEKGAIIFSLSVPR